MSKEHHKARKRRGVMISFVVGLFVGSLITIYSMKSYFAANSALAASSIIAKLLSQLDDNTQKDILKILRTMRETNK